MGAKFRESPLVCVFTRAPVAGHVKTRLARVVGESTALEVQRLLLERTLEAVTDSGLDAEIWVDGDPEALPTHRFSVRHQCAGNLGERMLAVIRDITGRGRGAIVIGSDCPVLDAAYLNAAAAALERGSDVVVGPVEDGGYVLIGMRCPQPELLRGMIWSTSDVFAETMRRAAALGLDVSVLDRLWDVDDEAGLRRLEHLPSTVARLSWRSSE